MKESQEPKYDAQCAVHRSHQTTLVNRATGKAIPDDEPVFIFRARDIHAAAAITSYMYQCEGLDHRKTVQKRVEEFSEFARKHPDRMKEPDS